MRFVIVRREALDVPDGINSFLFALADGLMRAEHEVVMVSTFRHDLRKIAEYYKLHQLPPSTFLTSSPDHRLGMLSAWLRKGRHTVAALNPDLVILNGVVPVRLGARTCAISHDAEHRISRLPFLRTAFKRYGYALSDIVCASCEEVRDALSRELKMEASRIHVIPTCVRVGFYSNKPLAQREAAILHMGTVNYKNPLGTLKAFRRLGGVAARLYMTGDVTPEIREFVSGLDPAVRERIEFLGLIPASRLFDLLSTVRVVSVPSRYQVPVMSPTVLESFASGTPVVASGSISRQLMADGRNGYVCGPDDERAIAEAFRRLLSDPGRWSEMSACCHRTVQSFSERRVADMFIRLANPSGVAAPVEARTA